MSKDKKGKADAPKDANLKPVPDEGDKRSKEEIAHDELTKANKEKANAVYDQAFQDIAALGFVIDGFIQAQGNMAKAFVGMRKTSLKEHEALQKIIKDENEKREKAKDNSPTEEKDKGAK